MVVSGSWLEAGTLLIMEDQQLTRFHAGFITDHHRLAMHEVTAESSTSMRAGTQPCIWQPKAVHC